MTNTPTKICRSCAVEKTWDQFYVRVRKDGRKPTAHADCRQCHSEALRVQRHSNVEQRRASARKDYLRRVSTPEGKAKHLLVGRAGKARLRAQVLAAYGGECACCGERTTEFLSIDHIRGDGASHRKSVPGWRLYNWLKDQGWPKDNFRLLCMNCNFARGRYGCCPHELGHLAIDYAVRMEALA